MKKILFTFSLISLLVFHSFMPNIVYASTAPSAALLSSAKTLTPLLAPFAPEVAMIALLCISAGVVFENREQIVTVAGGLYKNGVAAGYNVAKGVGGAISVGADALGYWTSKIGDFITSKKINTNYTPLGNTMTTNYPASLDGFTVPATARVDNVTLGTYYGSLPMACDIVFGTRTGWAQPNVLYFGSSSYYLGVNPSDTIKITFPVGYVGGSISVDLPSSMTATPPVAIPYPADKVITMPTDFALTPEMTGDLVGTSDWAVPFDTVRDVPIDPPADAGILQPLIDWLTIDWDLITPALDFTDIWKTHFKPFYDTVESFKNISVSPQSNSGKFYMKIPKAMGGDDGQHVVLDFTPAAPYLSWARIFIKWSLWLGLGMYILRLFEPKITIN